MRVTVELKHTFGSVQRRAMGSIDAYTVGKVIGKGAFGEVRWYSHAW